MKTVTGKKEPKMCWKVNTGQFFKEIIDSNPPEIVGAIGMPIKIMRSILVEVAERASQLNDPTLNKLMCRLALYEISDQLSGGFDQAAVDQVMNS